MDVSPDWQKLKRVWPLWLLLAAPAIWLTYDRLSFDNSAGRFFKWTGILGMVFILASLAATPVRRLFPGAPIGRWLVRQRRYLGLAGFGYSLLHTIHWLAGANLPKIIGSFARPEVLPGWIGLLILSWMALTSNDLSVRLLGPRWHSLQRWIYIGAPIAMLHWLLCLRWGAPTPTVFAALLVIVLATRAAVSRPGFLR